MGAFAAALATMLAGQERGRQATALYRQQLESRQLNDQIKRAFLLAKLKQLQAQGGEASFFAGLPQDATPQQVFSRGLAAGVPEGDIADYLKFSKPPIPKTYEPRVFTGPGPPKWVVPGQPIPLGYAESTKPGKETLLDLFRSNPAEFAAYERAVHPKEPRQPPNLGSYSENVFDPDSGHMVQYKVYVNPKSGLDVRRVKIGPKLSPDEQANLADAVQVDKQIPDAITIAHKVQMKLAGLDARQRQLKLTTEYHRYMSGKGGGWTAGLTGLFTTPVDVDFADYFSTMGSLRAQTGSAIKAFRALKLWQQLSPHIPDPTLLPEKNVERLMRLRDGRLRAAIQSVQGAQAGPTAMPAELPDTDTTTEPAGDYGGVGGPP